MKTMTIPVCSIFFLLWCEVKVALYINYFGYGSNLNPSILRRRIQSQMPSSVPKKYNELIPIRCILPQYKLVFNLGQNVGSYYASVEPSLKDDSSSFHAVHGLLYTLTTEQFELLARTEHGYNVERVFVYYYQSFSGKEGYNVYCNDTCVNSKYGRTDPNLGCMALTFRSGNAPYSTGQPSPRYLQLIRDGAKDQRLDSSYRQYLDNIQSYKRSGW